MNILIPPARSVRRPRWMIVDDDRDMLLLMQKILARLTETDIECYRSPQDALASFEARPGAYKFIITDLDMPGINGLELCRLFRAISPELKILLVTAGANVTLEGIADRGFCGVVKKPFTVPALESALVSVGVINTGNRSVAAVPSFGPG